MTAIGRTSRKARRWAILLGALIFASTLVLVVIWSAFSAVRDLEGASLHKLSLYRQILHSEVKRHEFLPYALAKNKSIIELIQNQTDAKLVEHVNRYLEEVCLQIRSAAVYVMNADGLTLASSNWQSEGTYVGSNYGFRPYFRAALRGETGRYFAVGATTGLPGFFLSYPIVVDGRTLGVVALKLTLEPMEESWAEQPSEKVLVADREGVIIASSEPNWKFRTLAPLSDERRKALRRSRQFADLDLSPLGLTRIDWLPTQNGILRVATPLRSAPKGALSDLGLGSCYLLVQTPMPDSDWTLQVFAGMSPVGRKIANALAIFGPTALAMALLSFYLIGRRFHTLEKRAYHAQAKAELEASEARQRAIIQNTRAALVTLDEHGYIESINPTAEVFFGSPAASVQGRSIKDLLSPAVHAAIDAYLSAAGHERGEDLSLETQGRRKDGTPFFIDLIISDLFPHQGYRFIATIHNITKRKAAEETLHRILEEQEERIRERTSELQESNRLLQCEIVERKRAEDVLRATQDDLIQAAKLAALGQMSAGITHELNQPLAAIRTFSASGKLLLQRGDYGQAEANFNRIQELVERVAKLTRQLKTFARKSSGERQPILVRTAVQQSLDLLGNQVRQRSIEVALDLPREEVLVLADPVRLEQVLVNLFSNALDAMKDRPVRRLRIALRSAPDSILLTVADTGGGIPEEILPQVFDPFFTTKGIGEGLGLGLSIALGIVQDWGGTLHAQNIEEGATFTLRLPRHREPGGKAV